jgi:hypothetical protein
MRTILMTVLLAGPGMQLPTSDENPICRNLESPDAPRRTQTRKGIPGDILNVALVGSEEELITAMHKAGWNPADPITLRSSLRIVASTVLHRAYEDAPVSNLYVFGHKQDLAFEQEVGGDARKRHHVRFWKSLMVDPKGRPIWVGSVTYDNRIEISHTTHFVTHHVSPDVDAERDKLVADFQKAATVEGVHWLVHFQEKLNGRNAGGDPYHTDGKLAIAILVPMRLPNR